MQTMRYPILILLAAAASPTLAQQVAETTPPSSDLTITETTPPTPAAAKPPLGWLSDPDTPPADIFEALTTGKILFNDRLRLEIADTTGAKRSTAITNRLRLGYETKAFHGFSALVEMENVATPNADDYFVPATGDGTPGRTVIADPPGTEVNQAFARYKAGSLGDSGASLDLRGGRQRITLDDQRFVGAVGWRQFEQTFDAVSVRSDLGLEGLELFYAYVWRVQRIFGPDGPNPDSDSHLINLSYAAAPEFRVTPFAYLLDFESDDPLNSSDSFGVRLSGKAVLADDLTADYALTYAHQSDAGSNPVDYDADFFAALFKVAQDGLGHASLGYQFLGSDNGAFSFRFPLGTNHGFQGFADNFLVTPAAGLQDLYLALGANLAWGVKGEVIAHQFWSDEGSLDYGSEFDFVASKAINPNWSVLVKGAYYDGDSGQPDTTRFWLETTFKF